MRFFQRRFGRGLRRAKLVECVVVQGAICGIVQQGLETRQGRGAFPLVLILAVTSTDRLIAWMIEAGCRRQARLAGWRTAVKGVVGS